MTKRIAVIGGGISGLTTAYCLANQKNHQLDNTKQRQDVELTLFESADRLGGHTATIDVDFAGKNYAIDTGFIVFNDWTYPNFIKLLNLIGVDSRPTTMSFSVSCESSGLEYAGNNYNTLFAQRRNFVSPDFWRMVRDILRFNKESIADYEQGALDDGILLGEYLQKNRYGQMFIEKYLIPMGAAIWSSGLDAMLDVPALFFVRFFKNHGLLSVTDRPQWRTIVGGSKSYIKPLTENFRSCVQLASKITSVRRDTSAEKVHIVLEGGDVQEFDAVVFACHSDQALELLEDPSQDEQQLLGAIPYQLNDVVLHTDSSLLPKRKLAWSSWNYRLSNQASDDVLAKLTYNMNILQGLESHMPFCVSLNQNDEIDKKAIIGQYQYAHPIFNVESVSAQNQWHKIAGVNNTWFCGAYWRNGFHEDGVVSALNVIESMDRLLLSGD